MFCSTLYDIRYRILVIDRVGRGQPRLISAGSRLSIRNGGAEQDFKGFRGLKKGLDQISQINGRMMDCGLDDDDRVFNLTWHDWLNTRSLVEISEVIANAALSRENSRGAHYREDFLDEGNLEDSYFTRTRQSLDNDGSRCLKVERKNVDFSIVKPGESLVEGM